MTLEHAASGRLAEFMETNELNWDVLYTHEAPRIYNYFRFRLGSDSDVEESKRSNILRGKLLGRTEE
jgi:hypothetical protein